MTDLIKIDIETNSVNARQLWNDLDIKQEFSNWIKDKIEKFNFVENVDYTSFDENVKRETGGTVLKEYILTLNSAIKISASQNNKKGKEFLNYFLEYISRPRQLTRLEIIELALDSEKKRIVAEEKLAIAEPKAEQYDLFMNCTNAISLGECSKVLGGIGRNTFIEVLKNLGILDKNRIAYQKYVDSGYFKIVENPCVHGKTISVTLVYPSGVDWLSRIPELKIRKVK